MKVSKNRKNKIKKKKKEFSKSNSSEKISMPQKEQKIYQNKIFNFSHIFRGKRGPFKHVRQNPAPPNPLFKTRFSLIHL